MNFRELAIGTSIFNTLNYDGGISENSVVRVSLANLMASIVYIIYPSLFFNFISLSKRDIFIKHMCMIF